MKKNNHLKKRRLFGLRVIALTLVFFILGEILAPTMAMALTGGPSQPEITQFQPAGVTDMVDVFSGDFGYNIPLLELPGPNGGYPFNLSYQSGITMDQEASWVGLGWNVNAGAIVRNMRGVPDEFHGKQDKITRELDMLKNETYGGGLAVNFEFAGADFEKVDVGLSVGFKVYENSYKGIGYGIDLGTSFSKNAGSKGTHADIGFNFSLDSQDGVGANVDLGISSKEKGPGGGKTTKREIGLGIGFHSTGGLNGSIKGSIAGKTKSGKSMKTGAHSSPISFSVSSHTPTIGLEMVSKNFTGTLSMGPANNGAFPYFSGNGFYTLSKLANKSESIPAYGYMYLQDKDDERAMADFNRDGDGIVYGTSSNLATPSLTYDFYNINGQGASGMFRPYRQDFGHVHEQKRKSYGAGGSLGFDVGVGLPGHFGISGSFNYSESNSGDWHKGNDARPYFNFRGKGFQNAVNNDDRFEGVYFKLAGDGAAIPLDELSAIGGHKAVRIKQEGHEIGNWLLGDGFQGQLSNEMMRRPTRFPRSTAIIPYTNKQMMPQGVNAFQEVMREYDIRILKKPATGPFKYSDLTSVDYSAQTSSRTPGNHLSGMTVLQEDGKRYVYALPAYNTSQVQETFSVPARSNPAPTINYSTDGARPKYKHSQSTEEYHERVSMPRYAHSYLLTSVLGDDYVDADDTPGPSNGDFGYWVKFNYVKVADNAPWRTPISGASYYPGQAGSSMDDKAGYLFGTKEIWYLASAETKTHILVFEMEERLDGRSPSGEAELTPGSPSLSAGVKLYSLKEMKLYSKAEMQQNGAEPLQTVHFKYDYILCKNTPNSTSPTKAKLTLTSVYFTYKYDRSGELSPYMFDYASDRNFEYNATENMYDRWGTYRTLNPGNSWANQEFPYTPQFNRASDQHPAQKVGFKAERDRDASGWHLTKITLPSGGKINIDYESDDYAFVQHKKAAQMFQIESMKNDPSGNGDKNVIFKKSDDYWHKDINFDESESLEARRVYFKLEDPIPASLSEADRRKIIIENYLECLLDKGKSTYTLPLYAKLKVKLRGAIEEYISGYYKVQLDTDNKPFCGTGTSTISIDGADHYDYGFLVLDFFDMKKKTIKYHPFAVNAWQHLRINLPRVLTASGDFQPSGTSDMEHLTRMGSLASWANTLKSMFTGYRKFCFQKEFGNSIELSESYIRLDSPDGFKYGGGSRVRKIYVEDDALWGNDKIGQVYDYTTEVGGKKISSGVASYEPITGGEETPMRTAKFYDQHLPFHTDNNLFFEYPINESYYPASRVGYSKVTVTSLATWQVQNQIANAEPAGNYNGIQTTGRTVHEFYTAKEFPTITHETVLSKSNNSMKHNPYIIPLPFVGMLSFSQLTASQGYSIILNDMHGKSKAITTYASKKMGGFEEIPLTNVIYEYQTKPSVYEGVAILELDNEVYVLQDDAQMKGKSFEPSGNFDRANFTRMLIGTEYDFFADFRESLSEAGTGGLSFNVDFFGGGVFTFPLPFPWPSVNYSKERTRLAVVNKVVSQSGVLKSVTATDGQSAVITENLVFDKYSGSPLLSTVNNNYDKAIYNYEYPAYLAYSGTGPAHENVLMEFSANLVNSKQNYVWTIDPGSAAQYTIGNQPGMGNMLVSLPDATNRITMQELFDYLEEGDEFIVETYNVFGMPEKKRLGVLFEKRMGTSYDNCLSEPVLLFNFPFNSDFGSEFKLGKRARLLLVRSGKRNLIGMKTGNIKSLSNGVGEGGVSDSPLLNRQKESGTTQTDPALYEKLTRELAGFMDRILDCNGQLPVGQYYLDDVRFMNNEGAPMFQHLLGLLESIRIDNICGGTQPCLQYAGATEWQAGGWRAFCKTSCQTIIAPAPDQYGSPTYGCYFPIPDQAYVNAFVNARAGQTSQQIINAWNTLSGPSDIARLCSELYYTPPGNVSYIYCAKGECLNCNEILGTDPDGHVIRPGYHIVLNFREPFKSPNNTDCYISHCLAKAKYKLNGVIKESKIRSASYVSPGKIRFVYNDLNGQSGVTTDFCMESMQFSSTPSYYKIKNVLSSSAVELTPYKIDEDLFGACFATGLIPNLYAMGYKGIWRPSKTYYYADERYQGQKPGQQSHMTSMVDLGTDGVYDGISNDRNFYLFNWSADIFKKQQEKWLPNETVTAFNRNSLSAEARDVLGIYSSVLFDRDQKIPVAVGRNMRLKDMFYENFDNTSNIVFPGTGNIAALPNSGSTLAMNNIGRIEVLDGVAFTGNRCLSTKFAAQYNISRSLFKPDLTKEYILSMWVGGYNTLYSPERVDAQFGNLMNVQVYFLNAQGQPITIPGTNSTFLNFKPKGKIMEGKASLWRKLEEKFTPPPGTYSIRLGFGVTNLSYGSQHLALSLTGNIFLDRRACFDEIRIFPSDGLMNTYVYDMNDHRLLAEGDENNYPTLYGYAPSGALMVVKKLTEQGIKTLKEIRSNTKRNYPNYIAVPEHPPYSNQ